MTFFYQQIVILELYKFLLQKETPSKINNEDLLKDYTCEIAVDLRMTCIVIPILKNNDPTSPVWAFKAEQLSLKPIHMSQPVNLELILNDFNIEVNSFINL